MFLAFIGGVFLKLRSAGIAMRCTGVKAMLRVSIGTTQDMAAFRAALEEVLHR